MYLALFCTDDSRAFNRVINENTCASRERLRNLKEDMINLNVKVDNVTEKLIMDRLGLIDKTTESLGSDRNCLKRIEDDLSKIKSYSQKSARILENGTSECITPKYKLDSNHRNGTHFTGRKSRDRGSRSRSHESRVSSSSRSRTSGSDIRTGSKRKYPR